MKKIFYIELCLCIVGCFIFFTIKQHSTTNTRSISTNYLYTETPTIEDSVYNNTLNNYDTSSETTGIHSQPTTIDTNLSSHTLFVNKEYGLPIDYIPEDLEMPTILFSFSYYDEKKLLRTDAARAIEQLFEAASEENLKLCGVSGYRSYARQKSLYETNLRKKGATYTNQYSAKPGYSEHQTGLAMDVSTPSIRNSLSSSFATTKEGQWLSENCHRFGYIIRYPKGKESITGYHYEPWHIRYVGVSLATYLFENDLTLEEYYNFTPTIPYDEMTSYDNITEDDFATATPTKKPAQTKSPTATPKPTTTPQPSVTPSPEAIITAQPSVSPSPELTTPLPSTDTDTDTVDPTDVPSPIPTNDSSISPSPSDSVEESASLSTP